MEIRGGWSRRELAIAPAQTPSNRESIAVPGRAASHQFTRGVFARICFLKGRGLIRNLRHDLQRTIAGSA